MPDKTNPKMTRPQKLILSVLLFFTVLLVGFFIMLAAGRMVLPL